MKEWLVAIELLEDRWGIWHERVNESIQPMDPDTLENCIARCVRRTKRFYALPPNKEHRNLRCQIVNWNTGEIIPAEALGI